MILIYLFVKCHLNAFVCWFNGQTSLFIEPDTYMQNQALAFGYGRTVL